MVLESSSEFLNNEFRQSKIQCKFNSGKKIHLESREFDLKNREFGGENR